jgi:hypothetical protein
MLAPPVAAVIAEAGHGSEYPDELVATYKDGRVIPA